MVEKHKIEQSAQGPRKGFLQRIASIRFDRDSSDCGIPENSSKAEVDTPKERTSPRGTRVAEGLRNLFGFTRKETAREETIPKPKPTVVDIQQTVTSCSDPYILSLLEARKFERSSSPPGAATDWQPSGVRDVMLDADLHRCFFEFLKSRHAEENLLFYDAVDEFKHMQDEDRRHWGALIRKQFLEDSSPFQVNLDDAARSPLLQALQVRPPRPDLRKMSETEVASTKEGQKVD